MFLYNLIKLGQKALRIQGGGVTLDAKERAEALHQEAMMLDDAGDTDLALKKYLEALELDFSRSSTYYNVGLIYKYRNQWLDSFRYNKRATELAPDDEAANWNLAIAATALRDWKTARSVWHRLGMPVEEGDEPIEANFGMTPVRLNPDEDGEVVWGRRIDPVRVEILNIPYPSSGFGYGDIVLHDGAAVGYRLYEGKERPVFNVLELFSSSRHSTYEVEVQVTGPADIDAFQAICNEMAVEMEDWTTSVRTLCKQCSEGHPHEQHDHEPEEKWQNRHLLGIASATEEAVTKVLTKWQGPERKVERFELALSPAGQS